MTILSIISASLKIINLLCSWAERRNLIDQGTQLEIAKQLIQISESAKASKVLRDEVSKLTDEDLDNELLD